MTSTYLIPYIPSHVGYSGDISTLPMIFLSGVTLSTYLRYAFYTIIHHSNVCVCACMHNIIILIIDFTIGADCRNTRCVFSSFSDVCTT